MDWAKEEIVDQFTVLPPSSARPSSPINECWKAGRWQDAVSKLMFHVYAWGSSIVFPLRFLLLSCQKQNGRSAHSVCSFSFKLYAFRSSLEWPVVAISLNQRSNVGVRIDRLTNFYHTNIRTHIHDIRTDPFILSFVSACQKCAHYLLPQANLLCTWLSAAPSLCFSRRLGFPFSMVSTLFTHLMYVRTTKIVNWFLKHSICFPLRHWNMFRWLKRKIYLYKSQKDHLRLEISFSKEDLNSYSLTKFIHRNRRRKVQTTMDFQNCCHREHVYVRACVCVCIQSSLLCAQHRVCNKWHTRYTFFSYVLPLRYDTA